MDWGERPEFNRPPNWGCLPFFSYLVFLAWTQGNLEPGSGHSCQQIELQGKLSRCGSEKETPKTQRRLRGPLPSVFPLSIFLYSIIPQQPAFKKATIQWEPELWKKEASLSSWWRCDPKSKVNWVASFFLSLSLQTSTNWPYGWQSGTAKDRAFWPEDQRVKPRELEIKGKLHGGRSSSNWTNSFLWTTSLPSSCAHTNLILVGIPKWPKHYPGCRMHGAYAGQEAGVTRKKQQEIVFLGLQLLCVLIVVAIIWIYTVIKIHNIQHQTKPHPFI